MNSSIQLRNAQRAVAVDARELERFAQLVFPHCCESPSARLDLVDALPEISVVLVSDRRIATLHRQFMQIAGPTDVLTFQHGEIVISAETARENAERFGVSIEEELRLYIVHGFLHLLGFDDRTAKDARQMETAQAGVLRRMERLRASSPAPRLGLN